MVIQMIAVGESTGALDSMLGKIAEFYEEEVDVAVANLTSMLEPLLMIFLGIVIGGVVYHVFAHLLMASAGLVGGCTRKAVFTRVPASVACHRENDLSR
jgi:type IV pilus assembly protein PilC